MIFITGGSGHLGNVLIKKLIKEDKKIVTLIHPHDNPKSLENLNVKIIKGDVRDYKLLEKISKDADLIIHAAALISILPWRRKQVYSVNVNGTKNLIRICRRYDKKLIYISSVHAFEEPKKASLIDETNKIDPKKTSGVYGKSKAIAALEVLNAIKAGVQIITVCPTGIIGPYDYKPSKMGNFFLNYIKGKIKYIIDGSFDFVDVRDVANGILKIINNGKIANFYILGNKTFKISELIELLNNISKKNVKPKIINDKIAYFTSFITSTIGFLTNNEPLFTPYSIHTLTRNYSFSHKKAFKEINYTPRDIKITLIDTINWFLSYFLKEPPSKFFNLYSI